MVISIALPRQLPVKQQKQRNKKREKQVLGKCQTINSVNFSNKNATEKNHTQLSIKQKSQNVQGKF